MRGLELLVAALVLLVSPAACVTHPSDAEALRAFHRQIVDNSNRLSNWRGNDPCGSDNITQTNWEGVFCVEFANSVFRVTELRLLNHDLSGNLAPELGNLDKLRILDVMWNHITGSIPPTFGKLGSLELLLLNGNKLTGVLPWELGNLTNMNRIQIDQNDISGPVPPTFGNLTNAKHFHMNNNSLNGSIPPDLGRLPNILHILLDNNKLTGKLPPELSNVNRTLLILQLDNNHFNSEIPSAYEELTSLFKLSLRNCTLTGPVPDLSRISQLGFVDLSSNFLNGTIPSNTLSSNLTSFDLSNNQLTGGIPAAFNSLPKLQALILNTNKLNGPINGSFGQNASQKLLLDFQNNAFTGVDGAFLNGSSSPNRTVWLARNPLCERGDTRVSGICRSGNTMTAVLSDDEHTGTVAAAQNCPANTCIQGQSEYVPALAEESPPRCVCVNYVEIGYRLKSPGFTFFEPYRNRFDHYITRGLELGLPQVFVRNVTWQPGPRLRMNYTIYPAAPNQTFNISELRRLYHTFSGWNIPDDDVFGPYEFISFNPPYGVDLYNITGGPSKSKSLSGGALAGILVGSIAGTAALVGLVVFKLVRKKNKKRSKLSKLQLAERRKLHESIKVRGVRYFTFEEMKAATNSFSESRVAGQGGYGKVYRGIIDGDQVVAVKRAEEESLQGAREFCTEIELLSRVHHRNLVSLVGFCDDEGEQMLIYEFMEGGTLRDRLSSSKTRLDFSTRLRIALGSAKGILYLHTEADPPIYHRDIKATNILLDAKDRPKVADFGLSRLAPSPDFDGSAPGHVSTVVKGTPGYLDPEYFLTRQLTDKSDVYSFGVVLMELVTGKHPITQGRNLVREVLMAYQAGTLSSLTDRRMGSYPPEGVHAIAKLAVRCCNEVTEKRPSMAEVVRDLEDIWKSMPWADVLPVKVEDVGAEPDEVLASNSELYGGSSRPSETTTSDESGLFSRTIMHVPPR